MTRINCIDPTLLSDQHLIAEYRELPRISRVARACQSPPPFYKMGEGHMLFFYDKGEYLRRRFEEQIVPEMLRRGFQVNYPRYRPHSPGLNNDWKPDREAKKTNLQRLLEKDPEYYKVVCRQALVL